MQIDEIHADPYGLGYFVAYAEIFLQRGGDLTLESVAEWGFQQPMLWQEEASYLSIHGYRKDPDAVKYLPMRERARKAYVRKASKHLWAESYLRSTPLRGVDFGSSLRIDLVDNSGRPKADGNMVCLRIGMDIDHYSLRFTDFSDLVLNVPFRDKISRGSVFQISRFVSPTTFLIGLNFDPMDPRPRHRNQLSRDYRENNCEGFSGFGHDEWIRTVFPVNLLTNELLDMPWGKNALTLGEALRDHPGTQSLKRFNAHCWQWKPHWEAIEDLRVDLFRMGRLLYTSMDMAAGIGNKWARGDLSTPYEYKGELPQSIQPGWTDFWANGYTP